MPETALPRALKGKVAVVTGASRGIGKGIALGLGDAGATVYVTGRTLERTNVPWPGTIDETAAFVTQLGGCGIAVCCDHRDDAQVKALFRQVQDEQGWLDVLVNNATSFGATPDGYPQEDVPFWELPVAFWDEMHVVGLRSHYVAASCAAPTMTRAPDGKTELYMAPMPAHHPNHPPIGLTIETDLDHYDADQSFRAADE
jgi:dehydrogenase/reductase SDR family member 1